MFAGLVIFFSFAKAFLPVGTVSPASSPCRTCDYVVPAGTPLVDGKALGIRPGYVICLNAGTQYRDVTFRNIIGTQKDPIIITNCGGEVVLRAPDRPFALKVMQSKHFRVTGGTEKNTYGIKLTGSKSMGLVLGPFSTDFVIDHLEVYDVGFAGIMAKTDPSCDDATLRGNFVMRNVAFHDNYIHDTGGEGLYIGHTGFNGAKTSCGERLPHTLENVSIHDNVVRRSGWDAIQLSSATVNATIHHNVVEDYSTVKKRNQSGGISIGSGTVGTCYSNFVKKGYGPGIVVFGMGDNYVYNNIIIDASAMGIFSDDRTEMGRGYFFLNNTIIRPGLEGLRIYSDKAPVNVVSNNLIISPGTGLEAGKKANFLNLRKSAKVDTANNYFSDDIATLHFVDPSNDNYRLSSASPVINRGADISAYNIKKDFYGNRRTMEDTCDIGATEFQPSDWKKWLKKFSGFFN